MRAAKRLLRVAAIGTMVAGAILCMAAPAPAAADSPAAIPDTEAWDPERAWTEMEGLQGEIAVLKGAMTAGSATSGARRRALP